MAEDFLAQVFPVQMGVNFGGDDGCMSQHLLHGPQVGAAFNQVRGEGMPQGMRADVLLDVCDFYQFLYNGKNHYARQFCPAIIQEQMVFGTSPD